MNFGMVRLVNAVSAKLRTGIILTFLGLMPLLVAGCMSKKKADAQARTAFLAGQRQALEIVQQAQARGPSITVLGEVRNSIVPWTSDLTLAKALVAADYRGATDPIEILIERQGKATSYDPKKLLTGEDVPLQPNDVVQIRR